MLKYRVSVLAASPRVSIRGAFVCIGGQVRFGLVGGKGKEDIRTWFCLRLYND